MAINYINTGSSANKGDGDSIRSAFTKVNANFAHLTELIGTTATDFAEIAQDAISTAFLHNNHYGLTADYNDVDNQIILTVTSNGNQELNTDSSVVFNDISAGTGTFSVVNAGTVNAGTINATSLNLDEDIFARSIHVSTGVTGHNGNFTGTIFQGIIPPDYQVIDGTFINVKNDYPGYTQALIQNSNSDSTATSDIIFLNNQGDTLNWTNVLDIGINNTNYAEESYGIHTPGSAYIFSNGGDLIIGTQTLDKQLVFHAGETVADARIAWADQNGWVFNRPVLIQHSVDGSQTFINFNRSSSPFASAEFIAQTDDNQLLKLGINGSNTVTGSIKENEMYLYTSGVGDTMHIGNKSSIAFYANPTNGYAGTATVFIDYQTGNVSLLSGLKPYFDKIQNLGTPTKSWGTVFAQRVQFNSAPELTSQYGSVEWTSTGLNFVSYERPLEITVADTGTNYSKWKFDAIGGMQFPDGTIQTTAYTGQAGDGAVLGLEIDGGNASTQDLELDIDGGGA